MTAHISFKEANSVPTASIIENLGVAINHGKMIRCLFHSDNNPSAKVNDHSLYCFVCGGKPWSNIDIVMHVLKLNILDAAKWILNGSSSPIPNKPIFRKIKSIDVEAIENARLEAVLLYKNSLPLHKHSVGMALWCSWGLSKMTAYIFGIRVGTLGGTERILMPDFRKADYDKTGSLIGCPEDYIIGLTGRRMDDQKQMKYLDAHGLPKSAYFLQVDQLYDLEQIVITEGQKDAMASMECGLPAIALRGGSLKGLEKLRCRNWLIYSDRDEAGENLENKILLIAKEKGVSLKRVYLGKGKDFCEGLKHLSLSPPDSMAMNSLLDDPDCFQPDGTYVPGPRAYFKFYKEMFRIYSQRRRTWVKIS